MYERNILCVYASYAKAIRRKCRTGSEMQQDNSKNNQKYSYGFELFNCPNTKKNIVFHMYACMYVHIDIPEEHIYLFNYIDLCWCMNENVYVSPL